MDKVKWSEPQLFDTHPPRFDHLQLRLFFNLQAGTDRVQPWVGLINQQTGGWVQMQTTPAFLIPAGLDCVTEIARDAWPVALHHLNTF